MKAFDILIRNGTVLTMDSQGSIIERGFVGIKGDSIVAIGHANAPDSEARKVLDAGGGLILPGLINGHTHAAMTMFRGLADDLPLIDWLELYVFPVERKMDPVFVFNGTLLACAEMIMSGTTTFCDMYLFEEEVARAAKSAGMRALVGEVLYDFDSPNYGSIDQGFRYTESLIERWRDDPLISIAVEPHAPYTCSPELLSRAAGLSTDYRVPLIIHLAETVDEIETIRNRYGRTPVKHLQSLGLLGPHLIADHCVHLGQEDMDILAENEVKVIHNPESNMKLACGVAPVPEMIDRGITVGLGTDGCASNNNLDLFSEMDMAAKLHKVHTLDPTVMDALTVLEMATIQGAKALGMDAFIGSIEVGKKADVIVMDTRKPHLTPLYNPYSHLVYAAAGSDVTHSVIHGRLVMEDKKLLSIDLEKTMKKAKETSEKVKTWILPPA
jgi:5-methylthioadenosine/S-adenosylhomocysteine deaminase